MAHAKICSIDGCDKPAEKRSWCGTHYRRWHRTGDPLGLKGPRENKSYSYFLNTVVPFRGEECLIWPFTMCGPGRDYPMMVVKERSYRVNREACRSLRGEPPTPKHEAAHNCGNRGCVNPTHIRWATKQENESDKIAHGTLRMGEQHYASTITADDVRVIRALKGFVTQRELGLRYGMTGAAIANVQNRKRWRSVE